MASVLDGIGDPLQTYRNQLEMEARGIRPLPCFHAGEDEKYLEYYIQNYEYITLGGMVGSSAMQLIDNRVGWDRLPCRWQWPSEDQSTRLRHYLYANHGSISMVLHRFSSSWVTVCWHSGLSLHHNGERSTSRRKVHNAMMPVNTFLH